MKSHGTFHETLLGRTAEWQHGGFEVKAQNRESPKKVKGNYLIW